MELTQSKVKTAQNWMIISLGSIEITACIADINDWMKASRLRLNPTKTHIMWLGNSEQLEKITVR